LKKNKKYAEIYFPKESDWYSLWDNHIYSGGKSITQKIDLETIPIFIKAGAFIPYTNYVNTTDNYSKTDLLIKYYFDHSDKTNSYTMFEDDGKTYGTIENNNFIYIILEREFISEKKYKYIIKSDGKGYEEQPDIRNVSIEIIGLDALDIDELYLNEEKLIQIKNHTTGNPGYSYDAKKGIWNINFKWDGQEVELIQIGKIK
jgi:Alpha-glucosidases, family 31 of glycosyl hydrola ses